MTRFIPCEEIDEQRVRRWNFASVDSPGPALQEFVTMPDKTLGPLLPSPEPAPVAVDTAQQSAASDVLPEQVDEVVEPAAVMFTEEQLQQQVREAAEQARQQGYQQGLEQGRQAAAQEWQQRMADFQNNMGREVAQRLNEVLHAAQDAVQGLQQQMSQELLQLAVDIARQVVRQELRCNPQALLPVVSEALDMLGAESKPAVVRLHPEDFQRLEAHLRASIPSPKVEWLADPSVPAGGCLVQSQGAQVDGTLERRWQRAVAALGLVSTWYEETPHA